MTRNFHERGWRYIIKTSETTKFEIIELYLYPTIKFPLTWIEQPSLQNYQVPSRFQPSNFSYMSWQTIFDCSKIDLQI